jgi:hypothetical protein
VEVDRGGSSRWTGAGSDGGVRSPAPAGSLTQRRKETPDLDRRTYFEKICKREVFYVKCKLNRACIT